MKNTGIITAVVEDLGNSVAMAKVLTDQGDYITAMMDVRDINRLGTKPFKFTLGQGTYKWNQTVPRIITGLTH